MNILFPVFAMMGLTMACIVRLGQLRAAAVRTGEIDPRFFSLYRGFEEPDRLAACSRHVINHFETPVLFYVICLSAAVTDQAGILAVGLAWTFVMLRAAHSYVHLTSNNVRTRFRIFLASIGVLAALWVTVLAGLLRA